MEVLGLELEEFGFEGYMNVLSILYVLDKVQDITVVLTNVECLG
jgi:hypothetical protein